MSHHLIHAWETSTSPHERTTDALLRTSVQIMPIPSADPELCIPKHNTMQFSDAVKRGATHFQGTLKRSATLVSLLILASFTYIVGFAWNEAIKQTLANTGVSSKFGYAFIVTGMAIFMGILFGHFGVASKFNVN